ncbi:MAG: TIGR02147 family protein [Chitinispirillaceae bacterium]|nr:TIGR02147 family protein [Chitinispirillaceae bacterium]
MRSIFDYLEYRDFLRDFYEEKKSERSFFSYRLFGSKVGMDASYLAKVLIKIRHIADSSIRSFIDFCGLRGAEAEYFETLVHFVKSKSHKESKLLFEKMLSFKGVKTSTLLENQYAFYQKWYHSAIRSVIEFINFKGDYKALAEKLSPPISVREAKESVQLLEKLRLIKKDESGRYRMTDTAITSGPQWRSLAIQTFQEETIRLSGESLSRHPKETRDISTVTMNINTHDFDEIRERVKEFRSSIIKYVSEQPAPDRVVQLNIQLFPLSRIDGGRP